jgi:hypothetical protein
MELSVSTKLDIFCIFLEHVNIALLLYNMGNKSNTKTNNRSYR